MTNTNSPYPPFHPASGDLRLALTRDEFAGHFSEENQFIELKTGLGREPIRDSAIAFSNADGGVILVGVSDDGEPVGKALDGGTEDAIHQIFQNIHDPGRYSIHSLEVEDRQITVIAVARREEGFAQASSGVVRVRRGTRDEPLIGADLQRLINERSATRFEASETSMAVSESAPEAREAFREAFGWGDEALEERLQEAGYVANGRLTIAGALYLVDDPERAVGKAYVELLRYRSDDTVDYDLRLQFSGPLPVQHELAVRRIQEELGTELVVLGVRRYELEPIPAVVLREAVANALAHRSYELDRVPVKIELRPSSVLISSPGGLPEPVTVENIRETNAPRNLSVITALRRFGLAEDAGRGIDVMEDTMYSEMLDPPEIEDLGHSVLLRLPIHSAVAPEERAWIRELERRGTLAGPDRLLLVHAARGEDLTNGKAREILQTDPRGARDVLHRLRDAGFLEQRGQRGGASYRLVGSLAPPAGLRLAPEELADLIVLQASDWISNADVRQATGLERGETRAALAKLVAEKRLEQAGERRGTRYRAIAK
jgi:ATP-dependent DNA helicase RecG